MKGRKMTEKVTGNVVTYTHQEGSGFYAPFSLLKRDHVYDADDIPSRMKIAVFVLNVIKVADAGNRVVLQLMNSIGEQLGIKASTVKDYVSDMVKAKILTRISHGVYKVSEDVVLFKQDKGGYLALKEETKQLTQINNTQVNVSVKLADKASERLVDRLLQDKHRRDLLEGL
jgi:hypothetical protein